MEVDRLKIKFTTTLDNEIISNVKLAAKEENRSVAAIIEELLKQYLNKEAESNG